MRDSIRKRLTLIFIGLAVIPLFLVGLAMIWQGYTVQKQQALALQQQTARRISSEVTAFLHNLANELHLVGHFYGLKDLAYEQQVDILFELLANEHSFNDVALLDNQGQEVVHLSRVRVLTQDDLIDRSQTSEFQVSKASGKTYYSSVWFDEATREPLMTVAHPLYDTRSGLVDGILVANVRYKPVWDMIAELTLDEGAVVYITDIQGRVIAHHNPSVVLAGREFKPAGQDGVQTGLNGTRALIATDKVQLTMQEFVIVVERPVFKALALAMNTVLIITAVMIVTLVTAIGLGMVMIRQIVQPIEALATAANAIRDGDLSRQVDVRSRDEIGSLAKTFNAMIAQLRTTQEMLRLVIDTTPYYIFWKDQQSVYLGSNEAFARLAGLTSAGEIVGKTDQELVWHKRADLYRETDVQVMTTEMPFRDRVEYHDPVSDTKMWLDINKVPLRDAEGRVMGILGAYQDVTEERHAVEALRASEEKFSKAFYASPNSITITEIRTGKLIEINEGFERVFGYSREEALGKSTVELDLYADPADRQRMVEILQKEGRIQELELVGRRKSGELLIGILSVEPIVFAGEPCIVTIVRDATEEQQAQNALVESESRYRSIVENALEGIFTIDDAYRFVYVNEELCHIFGYDRDELTGMDFRDVLTDESRAIVADRYVRRQRGEDAPPRYELGVVLKNGEHRHAEMSVAVVRNAEGKPYTIGQLVDITERTQAEAVRKQSQMVIENSPAVVFRWRAAEGWPVELVSDNVIQFGYTPEELLSGKTPYVTLVHPDDLPHVGHEVQQYSQSGTDHFEQEYRIVTKDGDVRWTDDRTQIIRDTDGNITHYEGIVIDITERKQAETALQESERRLSEALTVAQMGYWSFDAATATFTFNDQYYGAILNTTAEEVGGYQMSAAEFAQRFVAPEDAPLVAEAAQQVLESPDPDFQLQIESRNLTVDGEEVWVTVWAMAETDAEGRKIGTRGASQIITARKRAQIERETLIAELEAKNAELERFTYTASHDLKSPLVTINGFLSYVERDAQSGNMERLKQDLTFVREATDKMQDLLNDLLELSRVGRIINDLEDVPFDDIIRDALALVHGRLDAGGIDVAVAPDLPIVYGDRARLVEVMQNLIDNAARFMGNKNAPRIEIGTREINGKRAFYVRDNGIGIEPRYHDKVFDLFEKLDPSSDGTGIGLALVKRIIEVHGGRIWIESEGKGLGTTVCFTLSDNQAGDREED